MLLEERPIAVVVAGDVNSTLACALAAAKLGISVAHVEAGLRSGDWSMPEEINRVLTDRLSDVLFTHSPEAAENLSREGIGEGGVYYVGNTMIDSLRRFERRARERAVWAACGVRERSYVLVTLHRPSNVDDPERLDQIVAQLLGLARRHPVIFPIHPRTRARLAATGALERLEAAGARCLEPQGYLDFLSLEAGAGAILTDSGGVQEEASALGIACFTLRPNTERPVTLTHGTNVLLGDDPAEIAAVKPSVVAPDPLRDPAVGRQGGASASADVLVANYSLCRYLAGRLGVMTAAGRVNVLGCELDALTMDQTVARCDAADRARAASRSTWRSTPRSSSRSREDDRAARDRQPLRAHQRRRPVRRVGLEGPAARRCPSAWPAST